MKLLKLLPASLLAIALGGCTIDNNYYSDYAVASPAPAPYYVETVPPPRTIVYNNTTVARPVYVTERHGHYRRVAAQPMARPMGGGMSGGSTQVGLTAIHSGKPFAKPMGGGMAARRKPAARPMSGGMSGGSTSESQSGGMSGGVASSGPAQGQGGGVVPQPRDAQGMSGGMSGGSISGGMSGGMSGGTTTGG